MASKLRRTGAHLGRIFAEHSPEDLLKRLAPDRENLPQRFPAGSKVNPETLDKRWERLPGVRETLHDSRHRD